MSLPDSVMVKYNYKKDPMMDLCVLLLWLCSGQDVRRVSLFSKQFFEEETKGQRYEGDRI